MDRNDLFELEEELMQLDSKPLVLHDLFYYVVISVTSFCLLSVYLLCLRVFGMLGL